MLGHHGVAKWGSPKWGDQLLKPISTFGVDGTAKGKVDKAFSVDGLAQGFAIDGVFSVDGLAQKTSEASFSVDVYQLRLPNDDYRDTVTAPLLLVLIELWTGDVRVASRDLAWGGDAYAGRLVSSGTILRTLTSGTDDIQITLDDTSTRGPRFRDLFQQEDPEGAMVTVWMVLEDALPSTRLLVFEGKLERVSGFSEATVTVDVVRLEAVQDQTLCRLLTETDFPEAPEDSLSRAIPLVFGSVDTHRGLVIDTNAVGKLEDQLPAPAPAPWVLPITVEMIGAPTAPALPSLPITTPSGLLEQGVVLQSASDFPAFGVVQIGNERIGYTWKQGDTLLNLSRGVDGTIPTAHSSGATVVQVGIFAVKFADHRLPILENIRIRARDDFLGEPVPQPATIDNAIGVATWDEQPRIRSAEEEPQFQRVHFKDTGPENQVLGAPYCARESGAYRAFGVAQLGQGVMQLVTNTEDLAAPGDIMQVWIACLFDPKTLAPTIVPEWQDPKDVQGQPGAAYIELATGKRYNLLPYDVVPPEAAREDERTGDRLYDVPDPEVVVETGAGAQTDFSPTLVEDPGLWVYEALARNVIDYDLETYAVFVFMGVGEVLMSGNAPAYFSLRDGVNVGQDDYLTSADLVFVAGWEQTPFTSAFKFRLRDDNTGEVIAEGTAAEATPGGFYFGLIRGVQTFTVSVPVEKLGEKLENLPTITWEIDPLFGVSNGLWVGVEFYLACDFERRPPETDITLDPKGSVTNYFDVTDQVGIRLSERDPTDEWAFFADPTRGGRVKFSASWLGFDPQILETYWVVKYRPFLDTTTRAPEVFADVQGFVASRNPAEIGYAIVTAAPPFGLGQSKDRVNVPDYLRAKASHEADGNLMSFAVNSQVSANDVLAALADQSDSRTTWDEGKWRLIRRPAPDVLLSTFRDFTDQDTLTDNAISFNRTGLDEVITRLAVNFRVYAPSGDTSKSLEVVDAAQEARLGRRSSTVEWTLLRDVPTAQRFAQLRLDRERRGRWVVEFDVPLYGLELRFGDIISLQQREFSFRVGEIVGLTMETKGLTRIRVTVVVWLV